ncbi:MAG: FkbM family methyltransferase [Bacteroidia bacterium]
MLEKVLAKVIRFNYWFPFSYYLSRYFFEVYSKKINFDKAWRVFTFKSVSLKVNIKSYVGGMAYWRGVHEWAPMYHFRNVIHEGMTFYDVGANIGEYTVHGAKMVGPKGKIISFEPVPKFFSYLNENINLNEFGDRVKLFKFGLSDTTQTVLFSIPVDKNIGNAINEGMASQFHSISMSDKFECNLKRLDDVFIEEDLPKPDLIKIDVEGGELFVLKGATEILKKFKPKIILEFNKSNCLNAGYTQEDLYQIIKDLHYRCKEIGNRGVLKDIDEKNLPESTNLYCY